MEASREIFWNIGIGPYVLYPLAAITILLIIYVIYRRYRLWRIGKPDNRLDNLVERVKSFIVIAIVDGFLHRRFFRVGVESGLERFLPKEPLPGLMHFLIFAGCLLLLLTAFLDFISHYFVHFLHGNTYLGISLAVEIGGVFILVGLILATSRRYILKPDRLDRTASDAITLVLVFLVVISGFILEGFRMSIAPPVGMAEPEIIRHPEWSKWSFLGYAFGSGVKGLSEGARTNWYITMWWFHVLLTIGVVVYVALSFSNLSHILVAPINVFLRSLRPKGALVPIELEKAETFGVSRIEDFTWKQLLDLDACTRCGRCQDNCPAYLSGKPLSPKRLTQNLKTYLVERQAPLFSRGRGGNPRELALIGEVITEDELWFCTTCRACQEACPVFVEHVDKIVDMRRHLVLEEAKLPETAEGILKCIETRGHSCRGTTATRTDWTKGLEVKVLAESSHVDVLYWVGCAASLEDRNMKVAIALAKLLTSAGVNFGILGVEESCCGEPPRRMGNEYLFQIQTQRNIETLKNYGVKRIVTTCPHCFNTLKNEYPQFGGEFDVIHHTQFIAQLLREGRLKPAKGINQVITYQDSCYLGRYNDIYEAPRQILRSIPGARIAEMNRHWSNSFCCGGGGGRFWMEERVGKRMNEMRTDHIIETGASVVATACPYCLQMFEDGIKTRGKEETLEAMDIAELIAMSI